MPPDTLTLTHSLDPDVWWLVAGFLALYALDISARVIQRGRQ